MNHMNTVMDPVGIDDAILEIALVAERVLGAREPSGLFQAVAVLLARRAGGASGRDALTFPQEAPIAVSAAFPTLTRVERTVVSLVAEGFTNKEIAVRLFVSHRTIDSHVSHALAKLGLTSRVQVARWFAVQQI
jgi:DNA-binding NarL/FixJ family response regulator